MGVVPLVVLFAVNLCGYMVGDGLLVSFYINLIMF